MKTVSCYVCGSDRSTVIDTQTFQDPYLDLVDPAYNKTERHLVACDQCGFVFQNPQLDDADLDRLYRDGYRSKMLKSQSPDEFFDRVMNIPADESENQAKIRWLAPRLAKLFPAGGRLLDVGCGGGMFMKAFVDSLPGWTAAGIEPGTVFAELAARRTGLTVLPELYSPGRFGHPFQLVSLVQVLEHLPDPVRHLSEVRADLAEDGLLFVDVPCTADFGQVAADADRFMAPHLYFFSPNSIANMCAKAGLEVVEHDVVLETRGFYNLRVLCRRATGAPGALQRDDAREILALRQRLGAAG